MLTVSTEDTACCLTYVLVRRSTAVAGVRIVSALSDYEPVLEVEVVCEFCLKSC